MTRFKTKVPEWRCFVVCFVNQSQNLTAKYHRTIICLNRNKFRLYRQEVRRIRQSTGRATPGRAEGPRCL